VTSTDRINFSDPTEVKRALSHARTEVNTWLFREREFYADKKWDPEKRANGILRLINDPHQEEETYWINFIFNYYKRAQQYGLDTLQGRQALGKALVTMHAMLEASVVAFGSMPKPGVPSGEIK